LHIFKIDRAKSEAPLIAAFAIFGLFVSIGFYPKIYWYSFLVFPILAGSYLLLKKLKLGLFAKQCFLILDEEGIRYCFHLFQQAKSLQWSQIEKVNYQLYEINFKLSVSGEVISFQKSYLDNPEDLDQLIELINAKCTIM
jgi:hypothetical protein